LILFSPKHQLSGHNQPAMQSTDLNGNQCLPATPKKSIDLSEIAAHPLNSKNKRRSTFTAGNILNPNLNQNHYSSHKHFASPTKSEPLPACSTPLTTAQSTPLTSPSLSTNNTSNKINNINNNNNDNSLTIAQTSANTSTSSQLIYRGEFTSPAPNVLLPNFKISTYLDTPRKTSPCKEY